MPAVGGDDLGGPAVHAGDAAGQRAFGKIGGPVRGPAEQRKIESQRNDTFGDREGKDGQAQASARRWTEGMRKQTTRMGPHLLDLVSFAATLRIPPLGTQRVFQLRYRTRLNPGGLLVRTTCRRTRERGMMRLSTYPPPSAEGAAPMGKPRLRHWLRRVRPDPETVVSALYRQYHRPLLAFVV